MDFGEPGAYVDRPLHGLIENHIYKGPGLFERHTVVEAAELFEDHKDYLEPEVVIKFKEAFIKYGNKSYIMDW